MCPPSRTLLLVLAFGAYIDIVQASTFVAIGALGPFLASDAPMSFGGGIGCGGRSMHEVHSQQAVDPRLILGMYRACELRDILWPNHTLVGRSAYH